jgi:hypothetical protein
MRFPKNLRGIQYLRRTETNLIPFPIAVGQVTNEIDVSSREVKVLKMEMNDYLKMYFNKSYLFNSVDTNDIKSKKGDIVLIRKLDQPESQDKMYKIEKILFKLDDLRDPITGKKVNSDLDILQKHMETLANRYPSNSKLE